MKVELLDALSFLKTLPDNSVDLCLTDPPYDTMEEWRSIGNRKKLRKWFEVISLEDFLKIAEEIFRVLKWNRHFFLFCNSKFMFQVKEPLEKIGFQFWRPLIWDKVSKGMGYHYRCQTEFILFYEKKRKGVGRQLKDLSIGDLFTEKSLRGKQYYPTEKPLSVLETLIVNSTEENEIVLDPFMGSGSTGIASLKNNRVFYGCDISQDSLNYFYNNLSKEQLLIQREET